MVNDPENTLCLALEHGQIVIELLPDAAPNHVAKIKQLARQGFYDGKPFHRVIENFMAQTGLPLSEEKEAAGTFLAPEISELKHARGMVSMARGHARDSAQSQFFILMADKPHLDGEYTVFGRVISGMEHVDALKSVKKGTGKLVDDPDVIQRAFVAADERAPKVASATAEGRIGEGEGQSPPKR